MELGIDDSMSLADIESRIKSVKNNIMSISNEKERIESDISILENEIKAYQRKIKKRKRLPFLVSNIVEVIDNKKLREKTKNTDKTSTSSDLINEGFQEYEIEEKSVVVKTSTRQSVYIPVTGLLDEEHLKPRELIGVDKDSFIPLDNLPVDYDSRVKGMQLDEKPTESYEDVGGLDAQIRELIEAVVMPLTKSEKFEKLGIQAPKGVLLYGPPGTGKTLLARACAAQTDSTFLKLAGPQLVQMYIGEGAKMVRDAFKLAKEKQPTIIFIDELDAVGTRRFASDKKGDREVQRTMLELLNQMDGFSSNDKIKIIAATNRPDILDPALLRSGRLDRKIEFPLPNEEAREKILRIHTRKMTVDEKVNFSELARTTIDFNGAMLKAVCVEAGVSALRRKASKIEHEDFIEGIIQVQSKKKSGLNYYC